jgi:hypothetical protein
MFRGLPILFAAGLALMPAAAMAQFGFAPTGQDLEQRLMQQRDRIEDGARSGQLTRNEVRDLRREHDRIRVRLQQARADGFVSPREHERIDRELDQANRKIFRERRDRDTRGRY